MTQPHDVLGRSSILLVLCVLIACNDDVSQFVFSARIVDGDGGNPAAGTDSTTLRIGISEGELPVRELEFPITNGQFEAELEFESFSSVTRLRVEIDGPTTELIAAPPAFVPSTTSGFLQVVATPPSSCQAVTFDVMEAPRSDFGMLLSGTFALLVGGTSASAEQVEFLDALEWENRRFDDDVSLSALGPTRAATIGGGKILVLPTDASPFIFDMINTADRVTSVILHAGAGPQSALVSVPGVGAMVIGGEASGVARAGVSLLSPDGDVSSSMLSTARAGAVAAVLGEDVLVVGGDDVGSAEILLSGSTVGEPVAGVADGIRRDGLLVSDGESHALLLGGADDGSAIREDTLRFESCPASCASTPGPDWPRARLGVAVPEGARLLIGGEDGAGEASSLIEEVVFGESSIEIEPVTELRASRAAAGAIVYESGAFVVAGGVDANGVRNDLEFCVPDLLEPL